MEFFLTVTVAGLVSTSLKKQLVIKNLPKLCASIDSVISDNGSSGVIYCIWGQFDVNVEELKYGVRFSLPHCLNALAWSVTCDEGSNNVVIHCCINKQEHDEYFIETIRKFMDDWVVGLKELSHNRDVQLA